MTDAVGRKLASQGEDRGLISNRDRHTVLVLVEKAGNISSTIKRSSTGVRDKDHPGSSRMTCVTVKCGTLKKTDGFRTMSAEYRCEGISSFLQQKL